MNTKAVIYARVSTNKQADGGTSLDTQIDGCIQYAQEKGFLIVEAHSDFLSGTTPMRDRPGLMTAYNNAIEHEAKLLIVWDEDRLVRDTLIYAKMRQRFDEVGIKIDFVLGGSTLSEKDKIITTFKTTFASHEREQIIERTKRAKRRTASKGKVLVFDRPPYGYRVARTETLRKLVIEPEEVKVIRRIFEMYVYDLLSITKIANRLSDEGVLTASDKNDAIRQSTITLAKKRGYKTKYKRAKWGRTSVAKILKNPTYNGRWYYNKSKRIRENGKVKVVARPREDWIEIAVPQIINDNLWKSVQARLSANRKNVVKRKQAHPLCGRVMCLTCGRKYHHELRKKKDQIDYAYWRCNGRRGTKARSECDSYSINAESLEREVAKFIVSLGRQPSWLSRAHGIIRSKIEEEGSSLRINIAARNATLDRVKLARELLLDEYLYLDFDRGLLDERKLETEKRIESLESEVGKLNAALVNIGQPFREDEFKDIWQYCVQAFNTHLDNNEPMFTLTENGQQAIVESFPNLNEVLQHLYHDLDISVKVDASRVNYKTAYLACRLWESPHVLILNATSG